WPFPIFLQVAEEPSAKPAFTSTPCTFTFKSVRGMAMRKTSPGCSCPDFPSACSTAFHSESDWALAVTGTKLSTAATIAAIRLEKLMVGSFAEVFSPGRRLHLVQR